MNSFSLSRLPIGMGSSIRPRFNARCRSTSTSGSGSAPSKGAMDPFVKAGLTCGGLSFLGDILAQTITAKYEQKQGNPAKKGIDLKRTARMTGFGLFFYGPLQYPWYSLLDRTFPGAATKNFLAKVTLNQVVLGPVVVAASFAWSLALTNQADKIVGKIRNDAPPAVMNGWKFWVPAASINFWLVPLRSQVLYMSACGMLWTSYLSYAANR